MPKRRQTAAALVLLALHQHLGALGKDETSAAPNPAGNVGGVGQRCGGKGWSGATTCPRHLFCNHTNEYWWDCQHGKPQDAWAPTQDAVAAAGPHVASHMSRADIVQQLNERFAAGSPSNDLKSTGILIHQFHNGMDGDWKAWMPCPPTCFGGPCWCASFSDRFSASILNAHTVTKKGIIGMYSMQNPGFIYNPDIVTVSCAYPADGGSESKSCKPGAEGCVPGCGDKWCHFDPTMPNNMDTSCAWPASELERVLNLQQGANSNYNEIVVPAKDVVDNLPNSILAIFYVKGSKAEDEARKVHADFLANFAETSIAARNIPLVELDPKKPEAPFSDVTSSRLLMGASGFSRSASTALRRDGAAGALSPLLAALAAVILAGAMGGLALRRASGPRRDDQPDAQALLQAPAAGGDNGAERA